MEAIRLFKSLDRNQRNTFAACFLGWALDAFDFFLLTFVIVPMAHDFGTSIANLSYAITRERVLVMCRVRREASRCFRLRRLRSYLRGTAIDAGAVALLNNRFRNSVRE